MDTCALHGYVSPPRTLRVRREREIERDGEVKNRKCRGDSSLDRARPIAAREEICEYK